MGTYLYYTLTDVSDENIDRANEFVSSLDEDSKLETMAENLSEEEVTGIQRIVFHEMDIYPGKGAGSIKMNPIPTELETEILELYVQIFEALHSNENFTVKILSNSCAISPRTYDPEDLQRLTDNGKALSGDKKDKYRMTLKKCRMVEEYPTEFFRVFRDQNLIRERLVNIENVDLTEEEITDLEDLLSDQPKLRLLDILLTFHNDSVSISRLENNTPLSEEEIKTHLTELSKMGVTKHKLPYIPDDYQLYEQLVTIHNQTYNTEERLLKE